MRQIVLALIGLAGLIVVVLFCAAVLAIFGGGILLGLAAVLVLLPLIWVGLGIAWVCERVATLCRRVRP